MDRLHVLEVHISIPRAWGNYILMKRTGSYREGRPRSQVPRHPLARERRPEWHRVRDQGAVSTRPGVKTPLIPFPHIGANCCVE